MKVYQIGDINDKNSFLKKLNVHTKGVDIMSDKMELLYFYIKELKSPAINILKQDALSIGAELATPAELSRVKMEAMIVY